MNPFTATSMALPRRRFLSACGISLGRIALASLLGEEMAPGASAPLGFKAPHFAPRAKSIIYLFHADTIVSNFASLHQVVKHAEDLRAVVNLRRWAMQLQ